MRPRTKRRGDRMGEMVYFLGFQGRIFHVFCSQQALPLRLVPSQVLLGNFMKTDGVWKC